MVENYSAVYCTERKNCDSNGVCDCISNRKISDFRGCDTFLNNTQERIKLFGSELE